MKSIYLTCKRLRGNWFDLKRTNKLIECIQVHSPDAIENINSFHVVRSIAQAQQNAVINKNEFKQNEGYH